MPQGGKQADLSSFLGLCCPSLRGLGQYGLGRVSLIGGVNHLGVLLADFETYYNKEQHRPYQLTGYTFMCTKAASSV